MGDIISHDFDKDDREHARRLAGLLKLLKDRGEDILANPSRYFALASDRINEQRNLLQALSDAIRLPWEPKLGATNPLAAPETMVIDRRDYQVLEAVKTLIREWEKRP